jgi:hypothetical protein
VYITEIVVVSLGNTRVHPVSPFFFKLLFENLKQLKYFFHVHIMLILTCVSFYGKIRLYVAFTKMTKCPNNTIMIS